MHVAVRMCDTSSKNDTHGWSRYVDARYGANGSNVVGAFLRNDGCRYRRVLVQTCSCFAGFALSFQGNFPIADNKGAMAKAEKIVDVAAVVKVQKVMLL